MCMSVRSSFGPMPLNKSSRSEFLNKRRMAVVRIWKAETCLLWEDVTWPIMALALSWILSFVVLETVARGECVGEELLLRFGNIALHVTSVPNYIRRVKCESKCPGRHFSQLAFKPIWHCSWEIHEHMLVWLRKPCDDVDWLIWGCT